LDAQSGQDVRAPVLGYDGGGSVRTRLQPDYVPKCG
jgi:hypothetical protein